MKGASIVISYHDNSLIKALQDLFPDIGLKKEKLSKLCMPLYSRCTFYSYLYLKNNAARWNDPQQRRKLFDKYAHENGFDPLHPESWYLQPKKRILSMKVLITLICILRSLSYLLFQVSLLIVVCICDKILLSRKRDNGINRTIPKYWS
jgi:hypothetical protein